MSQTESITSSAEIAQQQAVMTPVEQLSGLAGNLFDVYGDNETGKIDTVAKVQAELGSGRIDRAQSVLESANDWDEHNRGLAHMLHQQEQMDAGRAPLSFEDASVQLFEQAQEDTHSDEPILADQGRLVVQLSQGVKDKDINALEQALAIVENELATLEGAPNKGADWVTAEKTKYRDIRNALFLEQEIALINLNKKTKAQAEETFRESQVVDARSAVDAALTGNVDLDSDKYEQQTARVRAVAEATSPEQKRQGSAISSVNEAGVDVAQLIRALRETGNLSGSQANISESLENLRKNYDEARADSYNITGRAGMKATERALEDFQIKVDKFAEEIKGSVRS